MSDRRAGTEILVHITAPSRAADDENYRKLAEAYLSFEPASRTDSGAVRFGKAEQDTDIPSATVARPGPPRYPAVSSFTAEPFPSPGLSFGSVAHNLNSPGLPGNLALRTEDRDESQSSWRAPPSEIEDSIPNNNISIAKYSSPTRILEHYLQGFDSSQSSKSQSVLPAGTVSSPDGPADTSPTIRRTTGPKAVAKPSEPIRSLAALLDVVPQTPPPSVLKRKAPLTSSNVRPQMSEIPSSDTPGRPSPTLGCGEGRHDPNERVSPSAEPTRIPSSFLASAADVIPSSRADSEPPPPPPKRQKRSLSGLNTNTLARSTSDIGPRQDQAKNRQLARRQRARQTANGLEVHSPEPPVGCNVLTVSNILTKNLEKLARDVDIRKRFQPASQTRELRPFERGYWLVDCSGWPEGVGRAAWTFLTNYVSNGDAGWGIWCRRADDYGWIRLYCWGCVVGHMHLVLYLASRRQLNYTATSWIGGDGEVVLRMEPKYRRVEA